MRRKLDLKKWLIILEIVFVIGFLVHSIMLFVLNKTMPPAEIARVGQKAYLARLDRLQTKDKILAYSQVVYNLGLVILAYNAFRLKMRVSVGKALLYPITQFVVMLLCTGPFALLDRQFWGDYLYPIWGEALIIAVITAVFLLATAIRTILKRPSKNDKTRQTLSEIKS